MSQSLAQIYLHIIFSTKHRYPFIADSIRSELFAYIGDTIKRIEGVPYLINGTDDHIHILSTLPRTISLAKYIEEIKRNSSRWIKTKDANWQCEKFAWQNGYGAFSVSGSRKKAVMEYIANQQEHHRTITFQEEYVAFLKKYNVDYDEKYLWV